MPSLVLSKLAAAACLIASATAACGRSSPAEHQTTYVPRSRPIAVTMVPLLVKEQGKVFPFLKDAFAAGGVLDGKEVYAFSPSTVTVVEGDTIRFTFINPEDDVHSFVMHDLSVALPPQKVTSAMYVARRAGIFPFECSIPGHLPMMSGELVVLSAHAVEP